MTQLEHAARARRRLSIIRWVAIADAILLLCLVTASQLGNRELVSILGPLHGGNFLLLLLLTGTGASDELWSWWFPVAVLLTAGPLGALVGELVILRRLPPGQAAHPAASGVANDTGELESERRPQ